MIISDLYEYAYFIIALAVVGTFETNPPLSEAQRSLLKCKPFKEDTFTTGGGNTFML